SAPFAGSSADAVSSAEVDTRTILQDILAVLADDPRDRQRTEGPHGVVVAEDVERHPQGGCLPKVAREHVVAFAAEIERRVAHPDGPNLVHSGRGRVGDAADVGREVALASCIYGSCKHLSGG